MEGMSELPTLKQRILRTKRFERRIAILLGIGTLVFLSVVALYTVRVELVEHEAIRQQAYRERTQQFTDRIETGVANLSEWSTDESLESYTRAIYFLGERTDADAELNAALHERVETLKEAIRVRQIRFEALLDEIDAFPLVNSIDVVLKFDRRMRRAVYTLSGTQGDDLTQRWSERRKRVVAIVDSSQ